MYYLHHYFDPDFSHMKLSPLVAEDGSTDYRYLGYVQNVVAGQVLAELKDLDTIPVGKRDPRFIYMEHRLPVGPNTDLHNHAPNKIVATANGYVFYHNGLISVKKLLNVRGNVGFHTGNIFFTGDLSVHGDIQTGFAVHAANILVKQHIESAKVKSLNDIVCLGGVKGAELLHTGDNQTRPQLPNTLLEAGGSIRLPFCERVQLRAKGNVIIDGYCLNSIIYAGGNVIIRGRLQGGAVYANHLVYVEKQLGSGYAADTKVFMGYEPFDFLLVQKLESKIRYHEDKAEYFRHQAKRNAVMAQEFGPRLELAEHKLFLLRQKRNALWQNLRQDEALAQKCRLVVPGTIMPDCEVSIGQAYYRTGEPIQNASFYLDKDAVVCSSPAMPADSRDLQFHSGLLFKPGQPGKF